MNSVISKLLRRMPPLAVMSASLTLLVLSACGGGSGAAPAASSHLMGGAMQGITLNLASASATVSTFAGGAPGADGIGNLARFSSPYYSTSDGAGNLYVTECGINNQIRKIVIATGATTTLAGSSVWGAADGTGTAATFNCPRGITTDGANLYVADGSNHKIRKIAPSSGTLSDMTSANAVVSSLTGTANTASPQGATDGAATGALFVAPIGITTDGTNLYVTDFYNNKIREISPAAGVTLANMTSATAQVSSLTGTANTAMAWSATDGAATSALFNGLEDITTDGTNLYVVDRANNKIRMIAPSGGATLATISAASAVVSSLTGAADTSMGSGATDGAATGASFNAPGGITTDGTKLYVVDRANNKIRMIAPSGGATLATISAASAVVSSVTGTANTATTAGHADGAATGASFLYTFGIATDGTNLYVEDSGNNNIRQIVIATQVVSTLAGGVPETDGIGNLARIASPSSSTSDGANLYVTECGTYNQIRKIVIATGATITLAGSSVSGAADGTGLAATFHCPRGITTDGANLYVVEANNHKIRKIAPSSGTLSNMTSANAVVSSLTGTANTAMAWGATDGAATGASFNSPNGITTDGINLYVAEWGNHKIRKIAPSSGTLSNMTSANAVVSSLTGMANTAMAWGATDGAATGASFLYPVGITTDGTNLYVTDRGNHKIRKIAPSSDTLSNMTSANAVVSSLTGTANTATTAGAADGTATGASFNTPLGITTDGANLYVHDSGNYKVRMISPAAGATLNTMTSATATVSSITGASGVSGAMGYADGAAASASFGFAAQGIITDGISLYLMDSNNNNIRKIK